MEGIHRHCGLTALNHLVEGGGCLSTLQLMEDMDRCNGLAVDSPDLEEAYGHVDPWGFIKNNQLQ